MAYKVFNAPDGTPWEVWLVKPSSTERRTGVAHSDASSAKGGSQWSGPDRRVSDEGPRSVLSAGFANGWLCFESKSGEKRRLTPVPDGWETAPAAKLWEWCQSAREVPRCEPGPGPI